MSNRLTRLASFAVPVSCVAISVQRPTSGALPNSFSIGEAVEHQCLPNRRREMFADTFVVFDQTI